MATLEFFNVPLEQDVLSRKLLREPSGALGRPWIWNRQLLAARPDAAMAFICNLRPKRLTERAAANISERVAE